MSEESRVSPYNYSFDADGTSTAARLSRMVGSDQRVLELGCGYGIISRQLTVKQDCVVTGVERDAQSSQNATPWLDRLVVADLEDESWTALVEPPFDVIVAADVIEHLRDPLVLLKQLHGLVGEEGRLVLSVPNIGHAGVIAGLLCGRFDYTATGILDETHLRFFTWKSLEALLNSAGYEVTRRETVDAPGSHEQFYASWVQLPDFVKDLLGRHPTANVFQYVLEARTSADPRAFPSQDESALRRWSSEAARQPHHATTPV